MAQYNLTRYNRGLKYQSFHSIRSGKVKKILISSSSSCFQTKEYVELKTQLTQLLARGYGLQDSFQRQLFRQVSTTVALDAALEQMDREYAARTSTAPRHYSLSSVKSDMSSTESFVSALDVSTGNSHAVFP